MRTHPMSHIVIDPAHLPGAVFNSLPPEMSLKLVLLPEGEADMLRRVVFICFVVASVASWAQSQPETAPTEFTVLRTDRVDVPVGETTHLNCSVVGSGDAAQISCESQTSGCESQTSESGPYGSSPCRLGAGLGRGLGTRPSVYHVALLVGSNQVGYLVSCSGGGIIRRGCQPLFTGQVLKGSVHGDRLSVSVDSKTRNYTVETSAYIGPLTTRSPKSDSTASPPVEQPSAEPTVKLAVERSGNPASTPAGQTHSGQTDHPDSSAITAMVLFSSEPTGADIYVDGTFMGNTPSQIQLAAGTRTIRIEAEGRKPWSREVSLTTGGKITDHAVLEIAPQLQIDPKSQPAVSQLAAIAHAIKECPEALSSERKWGKKPTEIERWYIGPPQNVVWDVTQVASVRAPYTGYIEFSLKYRQWIPDEVREKYDTDPFGLNILLVLQGPIKHRYEFDLGPGGLDLTRMLVGNKLDGDDRPDDTCWQKAARNAHATADSPLRF